MWIQKHSNVNGRNRGPCPLGAGASAQSGFTLIELLVVVAIIALLLSILLPSLRSARDQAKAVHCGAQMRGFAGGYASYATEFNDWIPGVNTTGVELRALDMAQTDAMNDAMLPVQTFDWMTPLIRLETSLPRVRADRFKLLLQRFRCAALLQFNSILFFEIEGGGDPPPDFQDFLDIPEWPPVSYLMPAGFQYWGFGTRDKILGRSGSGGGMFSNVPIKPKIMPTNWEVLLPDDYTTRLGRIGTPAGKIFAADGTRFVTSSGLVDYDPSPVPGNFGAFTTSGGWWPGSTAYGVAGGSPNWSVDGDPVSQGSPSAGMNLPITYRHSARGRGNGTAQGHKGSIDLLFFDGHVDRVQDRESRKIDMWYPKGSKVQAPIGMTTVRPDYVIR
ncbi:MAG: prepilin-type N-terminal cleavage/methylation domain-containing protein [Phycisphaerae bacterium]